MQLGPGVLFPDPLNADAGPQSRIIEHFLVDLLFLWPVAIGSGCHDQRQRLFDDGIPVPGEQFFVRTNGTLGRFDLILAGQPVGVIVSKGQCFDHRLA